MNYKLHHNQGVLRYIQNSYRLRIDLEGLRVKIRAFEGVQNVFRLFRIWLEKNSNPSYSYVAYISRTHTKALHILSDRKMQINIRPYFCHKWMSDVCSCGQRTISTRYASDFFISRIYLVQHAYILRFKIIYSILIFNILSTQYQSVQY